MSLSDTLDGVIGTAPAIAPINYTKTFGTLCAILRDPGHRQLVGLPGTLGYDEQRLEPTLDGAPLSPYALGVVREEVERHCGRAVKMDFPKESIADAIVHVARENSFHPVRAYLDTLSWDRISRLDEMADGLLNVPITSPSYPLIRTMVRKWTIACVARAYVPGCKVDNVLVLEGKGGLMKSSFFRELAGLAHFSDTAISIQDKDAKLLLRRCWIYEWAELEQVRRAHFEAVKSFLTSQIDYVRPPYMPAIQEFPRTSIVVGTTNDPQFLGNKDRRFWPIHIASKIDPAIVRAHRDQVWAEAVAAFKAGETWYLGDADELALSDHHDDFTVSDVWEDTILEYLTSRVGAAPTMLDVLAKLGKAPEDISKGDEMRVASILQRAGYMRQRARTGTSRPWRWVPDPERLRQPPLLVATEAA